MQTHELKINKEYLEDLLSGLKKFEIRYNDRNYKVGDYLIFDANGIKNVFRVLYIHSGLGLQDNYICMTVELSERKRGSNE